MVAGWMLRRPNRNHAGARAKVATTAAITVARRNVVIGSPLTFTRTFQVPWNTAARSDIPTARAINVPLCGPARAGKQTPEKSKHLGVDDQPVVRSPHGNGWDVRTQARAEVHN